MKGLILPRTLRPLFLLLLLVPALSGCFEIVEQVTVKQDGSGEFSWVANMSQSQDNLRGLLARDTLFGKPVPKQADISARLNEAKAKLAAMPGISQVAVEQDFQHFVFKVSCRFSSVAALDAALANTLQGMDKKGREVPKGNFKYDGKSFVRTVAYDYQPDLGVAQAQAQDVMRQATFTSIYRFEKPVSAVKNAKSKVSPSKTAVMLKVSVLEALQQRAFENTISF
jgi:hypothetical protein